MLEECPQDNPQHSNDGEFLQIVRQSGTGRQKGYDLVWLVVHPKVRQPSRHCDEYNPTCLNARTPSWIPCIPRSCLWSSFLCRSASCVYFSCLSLYSSMWCLNLWLMPFSFHSDLALVCAVRCDARFKSRAHCICQSMDLAMHCGSVRCVGTAKKFFNLKKAQFLSYKKENRSLWQ